MRKSLAIILLILYTLTSTGATVYYHQCGKNTQLSLSEEKATHDSCNLCVQEEHSDYCQHDSSSVCDLKDSCCNDGQIELRNSAEQLSAFSFFQNFSAFISPAEIVIHWILTALSDQFGQSDQYRYALSSAPLSTSHHTYILICNFRI